METVVEELQRKLIHGVYARELRKTTTDTKLATRWLGRGRLHAETEAMIVAAQDGVSTYQEKVEPLIELSSRATGSLALW